MLSITRRTVRRLVSPEKCSGTQLTKMLKYFKLITLTVIMKRSYGNCAKEKRDGLE